MSEEYVEFNWETLIGSLENIVESEKLKLFHSNNKIAIGNFIKQLKSGNLSDGNFMLQISQIYSEWLMNRES